MIEKVLASTVRIDFTTHDTTGALVAPSSAFASSDFRVYKDGSASEKTTTNGISVTSPFDSITGKHLIEIDTNNSTGDSGFWAAGSEYRVEVSSAKTVASIVQSGVTVGRFRLVATGVLRPATDGRTLVVDANGLADANTVKLGPTGSGTAQTARDLGASVLLSPGTGTGQLDITSGVVKANWVQIIGTAITGTAAQLAASITKFFNVATPTGTVNSLPDAVPGTSSGLALVSDVPTTAQMEAAILNEGDATALLAAIAAKVEAFLINEGDAAATIAVIAAACNAAVAAGTVGTNAATAATQAAAAASAAASAVTAIAGVQSDTNDIQSRLPAALEGGRIPAELNAATRVKLAADQPDYAPATATALTAALTKIRKFFQLSLRKDTAIATDNATELTEINADGGTGVGGYLSTSDSQEAIRDNSGGGGGGSATAENQTTIIGHLTDIKGTGWSSATDTLKKIRDAISNLISTSVVVPGPVLTAVGMPATLEIGDSYEEESCLTIYIRDADDNPVSAAVGHDFTDEDFAPTFVIAPTPGSSCGRVKGTVTYVDPGGSDEPYLKVDIPSSQSKLAVAGEASVQLVLKWPGAEKTLLNTTVRWLPRI